MTKETLLVCLVVIPFVACVMSYLIGMISENYRNFFLFLVTLAECIITIRLYRWIQYGGSIRLDLDGIMGIGLSFELTMYRYVFVVITVIAWLVTMLYSFMYIRRYEHRNRYFMIFTLTLGATLGFFISENIINMFTFFEVLTISLYLLIIHDEDDYSHEAGEIYLNMAIFGGMVQLLGIFLLYAYTGTVYISEIGEAFSHLGLIKYLIALLVFVGYAVKASCFPLHVWLPKAHPAAPSPASAILSGVMLKCGVFGIIMIVKDFLQFDLNFRTLVMVIAFCNIIITGILAMYQRNLKRIMAFSSMSQIGFILLGVALLQPGHHYAAYGTLLYIINHSIYKVLLFLCAGVLMMISKDLSLNKIRGYGRGMWLLFIVFALGVLGLIAFPGFNGFLGKTLLYHSLELYVESHGAWAHLLLWLFELGSMITVAYSAKMITAIFTTPHEKLVLDKPTKWIYFPLLLLGGLIIYEGTHPAQIMEILSIPAQQLGGMPHFEYHFYEAENIMHSLVITLFGILIYVFFINRVLLKEVDGRQIYINPSLEWISFEKMLYQPAMTLITQRVPRLIMQIEGQFFLMISHLASAMHRGIHFKVKSSNQKDYSLRELIDISATWLKTTTGSVILALSATMIIYMILTLI